MAHEGRKFYCEQAHYTSDLIRDAKNFVWESLQTSIIELGDQTGLARKKVIEELDMYTRLAILWNDFALLYQKELEDVENNFADYEG